MYLKLLLSTFLLLATSQFASAQADPESPPAMVLKSRRNLSDEDLRRQLALVPEIGLSQAAAGSLYAGMLRAQSSGSGSSGGGYGGQVARPTTPPNLQNIPSDLGARFLLQVAKTQKKADWKYLPWRAGLDSQLGKEAAERLDVLSKNLRRLLWESTTKDDSRPSPVKLLSFLQGQGRFRGPKPPLKPEEWRQPAAIPALQQLLQTENTLVRVLMVQLLANIEGQQASKALAQRALFDLSPEVRHKAVEALARRPAADYRDTFLDGFRSPWSAVVDHAAESLAALKDKNAVPALVQLLKEPPPAEPFPVTIKDKEVYHVRELVRLNHLSNCMVCHAPSFSKGDFVRGLVPIPGQEPPPFFYEVSNGIFVRADITFLKQDFSVMQPVPASARWPGNQRFDYFVRSRPATAKELTRLNPPGKKDSAAPPSEQREAILFALRTITGQDLGGDYDNWSPLLRSVQKDAANQRSQDGS